MNIALFGYGKMGKEIEAFATESGHQISARVDSSNSKESFDYSNIDVIIEFSKPEFAAENIRFAIDHAIPIAIGTTGWYDQLEDLTTYCNANKGCMLHATNFSLGVNAFFAVNRYLAKIMNELNDYKAEVVEIHHTEKLDAPSGTAITTAEKIISNSSNLNDWFLSENGKTQELSLPISAERIPNVPGTHTVTYASDIDKIELTHEAKSRKGFALGSVLAAEFLHKKQGVFTMNDLLGI